MSAAQSRPAPCSYADYLTWDDGNRWEIIDGEAICMSPAPTPAHQAVVVELSAQLTLQLRGQRCQTFVAPIDVRLPKPGQSDEATDRVVQPDVLVVCDPSKVDARGVRGAPDLVIEVLSPSTLSHDHVRKRRLYEEAGVREYWLVHPGDRAVLIYVLQNGRYGAPDLHEFQETTAVGTLPGVTIDWTVLLDRLGKG